MAVQGAALSDSGEWSVENTFADNGIFYGYSRELASPLQFTCAFRFLTLLLKIDEIERADKLAWSWPTNLGPI